MAEINFGNNRENNLDKVDITPDEVKLNDLNSLEDDTNILEEIQEPTQEMSSIHESNNTDYSVSNDIYRSQEELNDANKIQVTIADKSTPILILFGPPACGKTMSLIRLARFLKTQGYTIKPDRTFRPSYDKNYKEMCDNFDDMINSEDAARSTSKINFMLVQVLRNGRPLCQILEGPGEYYFNPKSPNDKFPRYVHAIINSDNRKMWAIMLEPDSSNNAMDQEVRRHYVDKISMLRSSIRSKDKILFLYNKIDETAFVASPGNIRYNELLRDTNIKYPGILKIFKNENPITSLWKAYNCDFMAFQTGNFCEASDGTLVFQEGSNIYPGKLWEIIKKRIIL